MRILCILSGFMIAMATGCGSGGGSGGGGETSSGAAIVSIQNKIWAIPVSASSYGDCAIAAKFSDSGRFGLLYVCKNGNGSSYVYEAVYGSYSVSGQKITLNADSDYCSQFHTIFWDPTDPNNSVELEFSQIGSSLVIQSGSATLKFADVSGLQHSDFPYVAARACYAKSSGGYSWISYDGAYVNEDVLSNLETNAGAVGEHESTKPKIDIVVFQDDSDSIIYNGPLGVLKPQMASFLTEMNKKWDFRFTVMPLLTSKSLSQKYVVASNCGGISGVMGCLSPSQHSTFNYSAGNYGWISSANFSGGDDRGFRHIRTNLQNMGGFIRSDASLAVIVISNGDDLEGVGITTRIDGYQEPNYNTSAANSSYETFRSFFANLKSGSSVLKRFYPIVVNSSGSCLNGYYGRRYVQMAGEFTNSRAYNICSGELNSSMDDIRRRLNESVEAVNFDHVVISADRAPIVSSIKVWKNGVEIPQGGSNGWTYVGNQNRATSYYPTSGNVRSGYMIQLSGSARYQGGDQITFDFDPI